MKFVLYLATLTLVTGLFSSCDRGKKKEEAALPYRIAELNGSELGQLNNMVFFVVNESKFRALLNSPKNWASKAETHGELFHESELKYSEAYKKGETVCQLVQNEDYERDYELQTKELRAVMYGKVASYEDKFDTTLNAQVLKIDLSIPEFSMICSKLNLKQPFSFEQVADAFSTIVTFALDENISTEYQGLTGPVPVNSEDIQMTILDRDALLNILNATAAYIKQGEILSVASIENRRAGLCRIVSPVFSHVYSAEDIAGWDKFTLLSNKVVEEVAEERDFLNLQLFFKQNPFIVSCEKEAPFPSFDWKFLNQTFEGILKFERVPGISKEGDKSGESE